MISNQTTITKWYEMRMARAFQKALETGLQPQFTTDNLLTRLVHAE